MWNYRASAIGNIGHVSASPRVVQELPVLIEWIFSQPELCKHWCGGWASRCRQSSSCTGLHQIYECSWVCCSFLHYLRQMFWFLVLWWHIHGYICVSMYEYVDCLGLADKKWGCSAGCGGSIGHVLAWNRPQRCAWNSTLPWDTYYYFVTRPCRYVIHLGWAIEHKLC